MYGRVVSKNYTFNKTKDVTLKVSRWKEGKAPNNYAAYLSVSGSSEKANEIASKLGGNLKPTASMVNNQGTTTFAFSNYELSQKDLENLLVNFTK